MQLVYKKWNTYTVNAIMHFTLQSHNWLLHIRYISLYTSVEVKTIKTIKSRSSNITRVYFFLYFLSLCENSNSPIRRKDLGIKVFHGIAWPVSVK